MRKFCSCLFEFCFILVAFLGAAPLKLHATDTLRNQHIAMFFSDDGMLTLTDRKQQVSWGSNFAGWVRLSDDQGTKEISLSHAKFSSEIHGDSLLFSFSEIQTERMSDPSFQLRGKVVLHGSCAEMEITSLKSKFQLKDLEFPAHLLTVRSGTEEGYVVVPHLQGILIPSRYDAGFMRYGQNIWDLIADQEVWWNFESGNLNMPWFGATKGGSSVMVTMCTSSDAALHVIGNSVVGETGFTVNARQGQNPGTRISSLTPIWKSSKGELAYARKMRIELVSGGYVGMAQRYQADARQSGRYVTLRQKIKRNPEMEKLIGAPDIKVYCYTNRLNDPYWKAWSEPVLNGYSKVNTTFQQVGDMADELAEMGVEKSMFLLAGWNRMGYDREHVDMWPPAEQAGGVEGLRQACIRVKKNGFLFALHDNYDDFYPDAPTYDEKYILRDEDGSIHLGGVWDGGLCHITCPSMRESLLNRNMDLVQGSIPLNAYYFDVITNTSHYECYDPRHPISRREDLQYRMKLLKNIVARGLVIGGERGTEWALPFVGFCEGLSGGGTGYHQGIAYRTGLTVPLFYLVYRECVVGYWQHGTPHGREDHANHLLLDLLYGQPSSWSIEYAQWEDLKPMIKQAYDLLGRHHEKTAHEAMVDHRYLTPDYMVQYSELEDGTAVWVNFGITSYEDEKVNLPPKGFRIESPGKESVTGIAGRTITFLSP